VNAQNSIGNADERLKTVRLDDFLTNSEHWGMQAFSWDVPNGKYLVNLYFAETFQRISGPGQRVFSFDVNGVEHPDLDIWLKAVGANRVYVESVPVNITSGRLQVTFVAQVENPAVKAVEIIPQDESGNEREDAAIRINAGGAAMSIDSAGRTWLPDQGFEGGQANSRSNRFGYGGSAWTPNETPRVFMNYDADASRGLDETELPQSLRFVHSRLDENGDGNLHLAEVQRFDEFVIRQPGGEALKDALLADGGPSARTIVRVEAALDSFDTETAVLAASAASEISSVRQAEWSSYAFTVAAMMIAALSFGHLLTATPPRREPWTSVDTSPHAVRSVIESLVLIGLLSLIDLLWTTFSSTESHFHEMNPLGNRFLLDGAFLAAFKGISLFAGITLLFVLRKYKGAQVASWWACMICTLVTFRWIVLDSAMLV